MSRLQVSRLQTFVGTKEFEVSRDFYRALGWTVNWEQDALAELSLHGCTFYLQRYYQKEWCNNSMLHLTVEDAQAWYEHIQNLLKERSFGAARVKAPKKESHGALVTYMWDPSGVLWHLSQPQA